VLHQPTFAVPDAIALLVTSAVARSSGPHPMHQLALGQTAVIVLLELSAT
jgi:hypothetical protein